MNRKNIKAVIVAGGLSSRMKEFKPLLEIGKTTIIEKTINNFKQLNIDDIIVVTGFRGHELEKRLTKYHLKFVKNVDYENTHMFDSVCIGLKEVKDAEFVFISPADSPFVQQFTLKKMFDEMNNENINLIQPSFEGRNGHPLLLRMRYADSILKHDGTKGLQGAIAKMGNDFKNISFADPGIILDADTPEDYFKIIEFIENKSCPSLSLCRKIQKYFQMPDEVKAHSNKVLMLAMSLSSSLYKSGIKLNNRIIMASCLLHDIAKGRPRHAQTGARWLKDMGYTEVSQIVNEHMELKEISKHPTEKELVYLADKMVMGDKIVSIEEKFSAKEEMFRGDYEALKAVKYRKKQAREIYNSIINLKGEYDETNQDR
ncbi:MAG: NTP transferase domain-containing protein [Tissierellia bacterium]|nr:NTP transferase domain-containing protein [Tissierellia bacterium]